MNTRTASAAPAVSQPKKATPRQRAWEVVDRVLPELIAWVQAGHCKKWHCQPGPSGVLVNGLPGFIHDALFGRDVKFIHDVATRFQASAAAVTSYSWRRRKILEAGGTAEDAARFLNDEHHAWADLLAPLDSNTVCYLARALRGCRNAIERGGHVLAAPGWN